MKENLMLISTIFKTCGRAAVALVACAALLGCGGGKVTAIENEAQFNEVVLKNPQPVLVDFYKGGCPTCVALDGTMDKLADEYRGRATIAKFQIMTAVFVVRSSELKHRYDISFYPTAILFVNGQEQQRWSLHYNINDYRRALNDALAGKAPPSKR
jgi:thioredoxin 1